MYVYVEIARHMIPPGIRFTTTPQTAGGIVERAYGCLVMREGCAGDAYKRVTDRSIPSVRYYRRNYEAVG